MENGHAQRGNISPLKEYARFGITGVLNTAIDFAVLNMLLYALGSTVRGGVYAMCKTASFIAALVNSYLMNKYWVFGSSGRDHAKEGGRFVIVSLIGFLLNVFLSSAVFHVLTQSWGASPKLSGNVGAVIGTAVVLLWNYLGYKFFVFKARTQP